MLVHRLAAVCWFAGVATTQAQETVSTVNAPRPVAAYSQAMVAGDTVYLSGQVAIDPQSGEFRPGSIADETRRVLQNLGAVLEAQGLSLANIVSTTVYLTNFEDYAAMNAAYAEFFPQRPPARSTVVVVGLPLGARIEVSAIAVR